MRSSNRFVLVLLVLVSTLGLSGCYASLGAGTPAAAFRPDPGVGEAPLAVGYDCSFHVAGLPWRDVSVREAARNALGDRTGGELTHVTSRIVYPAPFEVCVEVEGIVARRPVATARSADAHGRRLGTP